MKKWIIVLTMMAILIGSVSMVEAKTHHKHHKHHKHSQNNSHKKHKHS